MKNSKLVAFALALLGIAAAGLYRYQHPTVKFPPPTELDEEEREKRREGWLNMIHRAAPGVDWQAIETQNRIAAFEAVQAQKESGREAILESFAGGLVQGTWYERGSNNLAGSVIALDYFPDTDELYTVASGGTNGGGIFRGKPDGSGWTVLNNSNVFKNNILKLIPNGGSKRILAAIDKFFYYSDNEGGAWTKANGLSFPVAWGGNYIVQVEMLNDASNTLYALVQGWNSSPWQSAFWLYRSTDKGVNWTKIHTFNHGDGRMTGMWQPYGSSELYILDDDGTKRTLYSLNGGTTLTTVVANTGLGATSSNNGSQLKGYKSGSTLVLYALLNKSQLYRSTDGGATWTLQSNISPQTWDVGIAVSLSDPNRVFHGSVECYRSSNGGSSWTKINNWWEYYGSETNKLHADIMAMKFFRKSNGAEFAINNNHGGMYISTDYMVSNTNIGMVGLNVSQYYDVKTSPSNPGFIMAGSQDQGNQRALSGTGTSTVSFDQVISGDYGHGQFTRNGAGFWTVYPGGWTTFYNNPTSGGVSHSWQMYGADKPNYGWISPTSLTTGSGIRDEIYIGGGSLCQSGNCNVSGSYLIRLRYTGSIIDTVQFGYDFKTNSGGGTISAIATSTLTPARIYVGTDNGSFFRSMDGGFSWTKASGFTGPQGYWLYGSTILPSKRDSGVVYFAGSGYSNSALFKSTDGGLTFSAVGTGLPSTLIHDACFNANESLIFAATEVGPYVYVVAQDKWYSMVSPNMALEQYYSVEYVQAINTVRFGTYGRGIWDFALATAVPVELTDFQADAQSDKTVLLTWQTQTERNNQSFTVERSQDGKKFAPIGSVAGRGNSQTTQRYNLTDATPQTGINYYRLKQLDTDGTVAYSKIVSVTLEKGSAWTVAPSVLHRGTPLSISLDETTENAELNIFDLSGRLLKTMRVGDQSRVSVSELTTGVYLFNLSSGSKRTTGKFMVI